MIPEDKSAVSAQKLPKGSSVLSAGYGAKKNELQLLSEAGAPFADDTALYNPRVDRNSRLLYWGRVNVQEQARALRVEPSDFPFESWQQHETAADIDTEINDNYPRVLIWIARFIVSNRWDYAYLWLLLLWVGLCCLQAENFSYIDLSSGILYVPLVLMLLVQCIPVVGVVYLVCRCNDLMLTMSVKDFGDWVSDFIEYWS